MRRTFTLRMGVRSAWFSSCSVGTFYTARNAR